MIQHERPAATRHSSVIVVGGGQAGLSASYYLKHSGIDHRVLEKHTAAHVWRSRRWDSFCLVTPNWQCGLPGHPYRGDDPHGFMKRDQIVAYLDSFVEALDPPLLEGVEVTRVAPRARGGFELHTSAGSFSADQVIVASGGYQMPVIPAFAAQLPAQLVQLHSEQYRRADQLPDGAVLVVGSGQSGAQIAEDLHLAGCRVYLATGDAPRCARFYRGRDVVAWLADMGYYDIPVDQHPLRDGVRDNTNHYVTGRDGGRDIDLRRFASEGMQLFGQLEGLAGTTLHFAADLASHLDQADHVYNRINASIDAWIDREGVDAPPGSVYQPVWQPAEERTTLDIHAAGIRTVIWCIGFQPDFAWLDAPRDSRGYPLHLRGVTRRDGLYVLGLPWLHTWGSGRVSGVAADAAYVVERIADGLAGRRTRRA